LATRTVTYVGGTTFAAGEIWLSFRILFENKGLNWVRFVFWFWVRRPFRNQRSAAVTGVSTVIGGVGTAIATQRVRMHPKHTAVARYNWTANTLRPATFTP
jgi:hypothetical protein